jgi:hypothetical protein
MWLSWLEKQGHTFTKRDIDDAWLEGISLAKDELERRYEMSSWSEEDEIGLGEALWAVDIVKAIAKDEYAKNNLRYVEKWLKSLKERLKGE